MQIRYRITLVYTLIVTVIVLLLCGAVYFFSYQNRLTHFHERLLNKAVSTVELLQIEDFNPEIVAKINQTSPSSLVRKSLTVYDYKYDETFSVSDSNVPPLIIREDILAQIRTSNSFFFKIGDRDAVAIHYVDKMYDYIVAVAAYDDARVEWMNKLRTILIILFICSVAIVLVTGYAFSLSLVGSIRSLTRRINHISLKDISQRLDTGQGKDELQQLAATINELLVRLQQSFDTQRRFISNASHELSTPLTAISSQLDVALQRERTNDEYKKVIRSVKDDIRRLGLLVKSLLEIAKVSGSPGGVDLAPVRVDELLMGIPLEMKRVSALYEVQMVFDELPETESAFSVYGSEALLYSAIRNIVHNACKFSKDNRAVVRLGFEPGGIIIMVTDKGPGIAPDDLEHIFQPFFRGYKQDNRIHGTGLGLALANTIIGLHKGRIEVQTALGVGTTFKVFLPSDI
jgi:two-component system, OmpR family, sensor histidine kinase ArlS